LGLILYYAEAKRKQSVMQNILFFHYGVLVYVIERSVEKRKKDIKMDRNGFSIVLTEIFHVRQK